MHAGSFQILVFLFRSTCEFLFSIAPMIAIENLIRIDRIVILILQSTCDFSIKTGSRF